MGDPSKKAHKSGKAFIPNEFSDEPGDFNLENSRQYLRKYLGMLTATLFAEFPKLIESR
jgi:hypothetical protein